MWQQHLTQLKISTLKKLQSINTMQELTNFKTSTLGKDGALTQEFKNLKNIANEEKKNYGAALNDIKNTLEEHIKTLEIHLTQTELFDKLKSQKIDITIPVCNTELGSSHVITKTINTIAEILSPFGFGLIKDREIETDYHNFSALNIPESHPARQMHDTFYLKNILDTNNKRMLLRTHTSSVEIRGMTQGKPPFRFLSAGRVYRHDSDRTHTPNFHQIEGLYIDEIGKITMSHLKFMIEYTLQQFFNDPKLQIRLRPSYFPFTETSAEVDIAYIVNGTTKYLEVMGCGMTHPNVLKNCGIDPQRYSGFAFGVGVERLAMLKYNIPDLREFFEGKLQWVNFFGK